jgi:hypothetical protein
MQNREHVFSIFIIRFIIKRAELRHSLLNNRTFSERPLLTRLSDMQVDLCIGIRLEKDKALIESHS